MDSSLRSVCEHCGGLAGATGRTTTYGVQRWAACPSCYEVIMAYEASGERPVYPFGKPVTQLRKPNTTTPGWISYRLACEAVGYTLYMADTRPERDLLHQVWGRWVTRIMRIRKESGELRDRPKKNLYLAPLFTHLDKIYGVARDPTPGLLRWVAEQVLAKPLRSKEEERILSSIPPPRRGAHGRPAEPAA